MTALVLSGFLFILSMFLLVFVRDLVVRSKRNLGLSMARYAFAQTVAATVVAYLEQASSWDETLRDGVARKERALLTMTTWAEANQLKFPFEELDMLIEEAVLSLPYEIDHTPDAGSVFIGGPGY